MPIDTQGITPLSESVQQHANDPLAAVKADQAKTLTASDTQNLHYQRHLADTSSASITITCKPAAEWPPFLPYHFQKVSASNSMIIDGDGSETVDGAATITITENGGVVSLYSDGTTIRRWSAGSATASAAAPIAKSDVQSFPIPGRVDLIGANAYQIRFRMGFAGTFTRISSVMSGAALDADAVGTLLIAGGAVTGGVVTHANLAAAGDAQDQAITAGGAFTADQEIRYTVSGTNASAAFAGVVLEYTRS
jgi:hypothetical protein